MTVGMNENIKVVSIHKPGSEYFEFVDTEMAATPLAATPLAATPLAATRLTGTSVGVAALCSVISSVFWLYLGEYFKGACALGPPVYFLLAYEVNVQPMTALSVFFVFPYIAQSEYACIFICVFMSDVIDIVPVLGVPHCYFRFGYSVLVLCCILICAPETESLPSIVLLVFCSGCPISVRSVFCVVLSQLIMLRAR